MSAANYAISIKFGTRMQISISKMDIWQKIEISEIQDGGGRHIENYFGYISAPF